MREFVILLSLIFLSSCNIPDLKGVDVCKADSESLSLICPSVDASGNYTTIKVYAETEEFDDYFAVNSEDLKIIYTKLKACGK